MKVFIRIYLENEQEYLDYIRKAQPDVQLRPPVKSTTIVETTPKEVILADEPPKPMFKKSKCKYWNCQKSVVSTVDNPNPLFCSVKCEKKDAAFQKQNEKLAEIKEKIQVKRGRPKLNRQL